MIDLITNEVMSNVDVLSTSMELRVLVMAMVD